MIWTFRNRSVVLGEKTLLMGVINLTPDSFSDGGEWSSPEKALARAVDLEREGADILDLGAVSTRPSASRISEEEELQRLIPPLECIVEKVAIPISIDTINSEVALEALRHGASIINDVSALKEDPAMAGVIAEFGAGVILMHRRGDAQSMQQLAVYGDLLSEVVSELSESVEAALSAGIAKEAMAVDPGIGFAKTAEQNVEILRGLGRFQIFGRPVVVGPSRKSFLGEITGRPVSERVFATAASLALAISRGADIVRVHDVPEMRDVIKIADEIIRGTHAELLKERGIRAE